MSWTGTVKAVATKETGYSVTPQITISNGDLVIRIPASELEKGVRVSNGKSGETGVNVSPVTFTAADGGMFKARVGWLALAKVG